LIPISKPFIGQQEQDAVALVLASGQLAQGPEVAAFEAEFSAELADGLPSVAVNSGTSALHLAVLALGIGPGDEVIVPSFTFAATANAVAITGAVPVFVDIDPVSFCIDPAAVRAAITPRTRAVIPVHLFGHPADLVELQAVCAGAGLQLIEDAAQAHGAAVDGRLVGTWGDAGCFSFYPTKNMMSAEGGMVTAREEDVARRVRLLRNQGQEIRYRNEVVGLNNRMTDICAAIGRQQLLRVGAWNERRRENAAFLSGHLEGVATPTVADGVVHAFHQYTIRVVGHERDAFMEQLRARGVGCDVYYPVPVHQLPPYGADVDLPHTAQAAAEVLSLPVHPHLSDADLQTVVEVVNDVARAGR
jgi:perosamine synthetase